MKTKLKLTDLFPGSSLTVQQILAKAERQEREYAQARAKLSAAERARLLAQDQALLTALRQGVRARVGTP